MAGPDTRLSQKNIITDPSNGYIYIIKPDGGGGWDGFQIATADLGKGGGLSFLVEKIVLQDSDDTFAMSAGSKMIAIDFAHVSGSPKIKVGSTPGGDEYSLAELDVPSSGYLPLTLNVIFKNSETVYISISGGTVNYNYIYIPNYF